jgi:prepilin-type N-terminal cleavage/methylation domain-containing protein
MKNNTQAGFSLVELLVVVVIIGVVAALAVPNLQKGLRAAENGTTFATMRTIASSQAGFFSQKNRFARITELNTVLHEIIGTNAGDRVIRGEYVFEMSPATPTDADLRNEYTITATRFVDSIVYKYELTQTGEIVQILP